MEFKPAPVSLMVLLLAFMAACPSPATASSPSSLDFFMYIAVQNNSFLDNPAPFTAVQSAQPAQPQNNSFGIIHTFDNPITSAPSLTNSTRLGSVQGWYGDVGQNVLTLFMVQTFSINTTQSVGTFTLMGIDVASDAVKYSPITGGTGDFAYARGVASKTLVSTATVDSETVSWFQYHIDFKY